MNNIPYQNSFRDNLKSFFSLKGFIGFNLTSVRIPLILSIFMVLLGNPPFQLLNILNAQDSGEGLVSVYAKKELVNSPFPLKPGIELYTFWDGENFPKEAFIQLFASPSPSGDSEKLPPAQVNQAHPDAQEIRRASQLASQTFGSTPLTEKEALQFFRFIGSVERFYFFEDLPGVQLASSQSGFAFPVESNLWKSFEKPEGGDDGIKTSQSGGFTYWRVLGCHNLPAADNKPAVILTEETLDGSVYRFSMKKILLMGDLKGLKLPIFH